MSRTKAERDNGVPPSRPPETSTGQTGLDKALSALQSGMRTAALRSDTSHRDQQANQQFGARLQEMTGWSH
jgi:hypothetical protein